VWGARTDRRWTVPVASMLALPALWYGGFSMLLAVLPLLPARTPAELAERIRRGWHRRSPRPDNA
jgi:hypothetical protein